MRTSRMIWAAVTATALMLPATAAQATTIEEIESVDIEVLDAANPYHPSRGTGMARQSAGIILNTGAVMQARVTNGLSVKLDALSIGEATDVRVTLPETGEWITVTARADSAVFFNLRDENAWAHSPEVEFRIVSGDTDALPTFRHGDDQASFLAGWESGDAAFSLIEDEAISILVPRKDLPIMKTVGGANNDFTSLDDLIEFYRDLIGTYDDWTGIVDDPSDTVNAQTPHRYFARADVSDGDFAYYSTGNYIAQSGDSAAIFLSSRTGWGMLHEFAHGYDSQWWSPADDKDLSLGEVFNNVYTAKFQELETGAQLRLYPVSKDATRAGFEANRLAAGDSWNINGVDGSVRLDLLMRMIEVTGMEGFQNMHRELRAVHASGTDPRTLRIADRLNRYLGSANGVNFTAWLESNNLVLDPTQRAHAMDVQPAPLAVPLNDLLESPERSVQLATEIGVDSAYRLVTPEELVSTGITSDITVAATGAAPASVEGRSVSLWDGTRKVASAPFVGGTATFADVPLGAYTVRMPYNNVNVLPTSEWVLADHDGEQLEVDYSANADHLVGSTTLEMRGVANYLFAALKHDTSNKTLTLTDNLFDPHSGFGASEYAHVTVTSPAGEVLLSRDFLGNQRRTVERAVTVDAPVGTTITWRHAEGGRTWPIDNSTGERIPALQLSGRASVTYVVTPFGLEKQNEPGTALQRYIADFDNEVRKLTERYEQNPDGRYSSEAATLIGVMHTLPEGPFMQRLFTVAGLLDQLLQASRR